jgi:hypothetical protein
MLLVALLYEYKVANALVFSKLLFSKPVLGHKALGPHIDDELRTDSLLTLNLDRSSHLLNDFLANRESKSGTLLVPGRVLIELTKVDE